MDLSEVYVDFHNADSAGRVRLNCVGTIEDLDRLGLVLEDGLKLRLHDEELETEGSVRRSAEEGGWVAEIDWGSLHPRGAEVARTQS